jgi:hypothetical protein
MTNFWVGLWTVLWFFGLAVFSVLSVLVTVCGARDLTALLGALRQRHMAQKAEAAQPGEPT